MVVGIGASAGGLEAIRELLSALPSSGGCALVFVQHMLADHKSLMAQLLAASTTWPVSEVTHDTPVAAGHVYVAPPGSSISLENSILKPHQRSVDHTQYRPIDTFFQSLAEVRGPRAVGVVLSGTGSDGVHGVESIKSARGTVLVQSPESARFDEMPQSAIATG